MKVNSDFFFSIRTIVILWILILGLFSSCGHKSGRKATMDKNKKVNIYDREIDDRTTLRSKAILEIQSLNGVKYIWIEINGLRLKFIFDTGASNISISSAEATVLYRQGTLRKEDIIDIQYFTDATGSVSAGTKINLRTVKIGDRILQNIEATVIDNVDAPLLLGQSALERFGKITIDNRKNIIILE